MSRLSQAISSAGRFVLVACMATAACAAEADAPQQPAAIPSVMVTPPARPMANAALAWWRAIACLPERESPIMRLAAQPLKATLPDPQADDYFNGPADALALLALGAAMPTCDWGVDAASEGMLARLPHLNRMRELLRLAGLRVCWCAAHHADAAAVDQLVIMLRTSRRMPGTRPALLACMVANSCTNIAIAIAAGVLPHLPDEQRHRLAVALGELPAAPTIADALDQELDQLRVLCTQLRELPAAQRGARAAHLLADVGNSPAVAQIDLSDAGLAAAERAYAVEIARWQTYLRLPPANRVQPITPLFSTGEQTPHALLACLAPSIGMLAQSELRDLLLMAELQTAIACLAGDQAAALAAHPAPLSGKPFRLEKTDHGFRLLAETPGLKLVPRLEVGAMTPPEEAPPASF